MTAAHYGIHWKHVMKHELEAQAQVETSQQRLWIVIIAFVCAFAVLSLRLFDISVLKDIPANLPANYSAQPLTLDRADIVDRNGDPLASNLRTSSVFANARLIDNPAEVAKMLHHALPDQPYNTLYEKLKSKKSFVWIKRNLTPDEEYAVNRLGIPGLTLEEGQTRVYPQGNLFSHILGYVDVDGTGIAGVEKYMDKYMKDTLNQGEQLKLSLDLRVQNILYTILSQGVSEFKAIGANGVVMDVTNGEILGMVSLPDFDPNNVKESKDPQRFNRNTLGVYEMGSTFKTITIANALDSGAVSLYDSYDVSQPIHYGNFTIKDFHPENGALTVPEILMHSSNVGTAKIALDVGKKRQREFINELGLMSPLEIELPERGNSVYPDVWADIHSMTIAFGHGMAITPLHLVQAVSAIVNGGTFYPATLIKGKKNTGRQVISAATSETMRKLMRLVVTDGTGSKANIKGYLVGGKTGTAEKASHGGYNHHAMLSSFVGVYPLNKPRYLVLVMLDEPQGNKETGGFATGGMTAAPLVGKIIEQMSPVLSIEPVDESSKTLQKAFYVDYKRKHSEFAANPDLAR
ncbi:MAG: penicillin-binding protein 2 [Alphaproteobacteria bacterium]|nr:penicillin-binding protein 2 [Alphaproteobacteria bacterium]